MPTEYNHKLYYSYDEIHSKMYELAQKIKNSSESFDFMVAIGNGGYTPARMLQTFLNLPIYCICVKSYEGQQQCQFKEYQWLPNPEILVPNSRILLVDEMDDTRSTLAYCIDRIQENNPTKISVAVLHNKQKPKVRELDSNDYFVAEEVDNSWIVYPWECDQPMVYGPQSV